MVTLTLLTAQAVAAVLVVLDHLIMELVVLDHQAALLDQV
tara:strand:+ start:271 stop:390 length:120 start_codon:yes stop_codon:yes gene_type:complete